MKEVTTVLTTTPASSTSIVIGGGEFRFSAAHTGLHDGELEPLHGHTFTVTLRVAGTPDIDRMIVDFTTVKDALREAITPLHRRTLLAQHCPGVVVDVETEVVRVSSPGKFYLLPRADTVVLPINNTTTEELAIYLLDTIAPALAGAALDHAELELAEAPGQAAVVRRRLPTGTHSVTPSESEDTR
ncbi:hypothetical protein GZH49_11975 [Nocardia terpenica]|uniref:6-pyruvoyl trahydropterin synthase family protein n=1 Tax=Nocardia terpenica TaxID=455432 RepID=UPI002FE12B55